MTLFNIVISACIWAAVGWSREMGNGQHLIIACYLTIQSIPVFTSTNSLTSRCIYCTSDMRSCNLESCHCLSVYLCFDVQSRKTDIASSRCSFFCFGISGKYLSAVNDSFNFTALNFHALKMTQDMTVLLLPRPVNGNLWMCLSSHTTRQVSQELLAPSVLGWSRFLSL